MKLFNVSYKGMIATIRDEGFDEIIEIMKTSNGKDRMPSIINAIEKCRKKLMKMHKLSDIERKNLADDIALWYAYEIANNNAPRYPLTH